MAFSWLIFKPSVIRCHLGMDIFLSRNFYTKFLLSFTRLIYWWLNLSAQEFLSQFFRRKLSQIYFFELKLCYVESCGRTFGNKANNYFPLLLLGSSINVWKNSSRPLRTFDHLQCNWEKLLIFSFTESFSASNWKLLKILYRFSSLVQCNKYLFQFFSLAISSFSPSSIHLKLNPVDKLFFVVKSMKVTKFLLTMHLIRTLEIMEVLKEEISHSIGNRSMGIFEVFNVPLKFLNSKLWMVSWEMPQSDCGW